MNNFDALRFALAAVVLWSHTFPLSGRPMDPLFRLSRQIDGGSFAVEAFFIVSGFLVAQSWEVDPSAFRFGMKRGLRIAPALLASLGFGALIVGPLASVQPARSYFASGAPWWHFLGVVLNRHLAIPGTFPDNPMPAAMNYSLWSLRFEIGCYAAIVAIGWLGRARWPVAVSTAVLAAFTVRLLAAAAGMDRMSFVANGARLSTAFAVGAALWVFRTRVLYSSVRVGAASGLLTLALLTRGLWIVLPFLAGYLLVGMGVWKRLPLSRFGQHGDVSYGMYVFAYPIQQTIVHLLGPTRPIWILFSVSLLTTLGIAAASWRYIEEPALALKARLARHA